MWLERFAGRVIGGAMDPAASAGPDTGEGRIAAAIVAVCAADTLLRRGDEAAATARLASALDREPGLWSDVRLMLGARALARARRAPEDALTGACERS